MRFFIPVVCSYLLLCSPTPSSAQTRIPDWENWLAQHADTVQASATTASNYQWQALDSALKDVKLVLLDEQTHGEENVFALKAELVKHLHQHHGFEVLVMESGLYDIAELSSKAQAGESLRQLAPGNLFYLYAKSPAVLALLDYIQAQQASPRPLRLAGMDSQHTGLLSQTRLLDDLASQAGLQSEQQRQALGWPNFSTLAQQLFKLKRDLPKPEQQQAFFRTLQQVHHLLRHQPDSYWRDICASIANQAQRYWGLAPEQRSPQMAKNLLHLLQQRYAGKKVIVWGHFVHLNRSGLPTGKNVGHLLAQHYGRQMYLAHFTSNQGQYYNFLNAQLTPISPMPFKTIENLMAKQTGQVIFANWRNLPAPLRQDASMQAALHSYLPDQLYDHPPATARWKNRIDGSFFIREITPVQPLV